MANVVQNDHHKFGKIRSLFFPIYAYELKKAIPMGFMLFCILFNYHCVRNIKDALVVTAGSSGAEVISFLKGCCVAPSAILFMLIYVKMSNIFSNEHLFYATLTPFILFFGCFAFLIYPNIDALHASAETIATWRAQAPKFLHWPVAIVGNWAYSTFYVLAEIWGSAIISLSFWQFANQITKAEEAGRIYVFLGAIGQTAPFFAGKLGEYFSKVRATNISSTEAWGTTLKYILGAVFVLGVCTMLIYRWMYTHVLTDKRYYDKPELPGIKKGKKKISLWQSMKTMITSPYLGLIASLVICYGISVNLLEGQWKKQMQIQYPNANDYNFMMNTMSVWISIVSTALYIGGGGIIRVFGWFKTAIVTPVLLLVLGAVFFAFILFRDSLMPMLQGISPTWTCAWFASILGLIIVVASKSAKYVLFDTTKEISYIPLDEEMKVKGKAVVDVVGGRFGKAGGAWITMALLLIPGSGGNLVKIAPYAFGLFIVFCIWWIVCAKKLSRRIEAATAAEKSGQQA